MLRYFRGEVKNVDSKDNRDKDRPSRESGLIDCAYRKFFISNIFHYFFLILKIYCDFGILWLIKRLFI